MTMNGFLLFLIMVMEFSVSVAHTLLPEPTLDLSDPDLLDLDLDLSDRDLPKLTRERRLPDNPPDHPPDNPPLSQQEKEMLVRLHNAVRTNVNPPAANMPFLVWNKSVEVTAQYWANSCTLDHGQYQLEYLPGVYGQNICMWSGHEENRTNPTVCFANWYEQSKSYSYGGKSEDQCTRGSYMCEQYSQIVWAKSQSFGCAKKYCQGHGDSTGMHWLVCNYWKAGNGQDQQPYEKGGSCTECPEGYTECHDKLCHRPEESRCKRMKRCFNTEELDPSTCICKLKTQFTNDTGSSNLLGSGATECLSESSPGLVIVMLFFIFCT